MNLDPVGRWRSNEEGRLAWKEIVDGDAFKAAVIAALAEFQADICFRENGAHLISGANLFVVRLCNMHEISEKPKRKSFSLPHPEAGT